MAILCCNDEHQIDWFEEKSKLLAKKRGYELEDIALAAFSVPCALYEPNQYPGQNREVFVLKNKFYTLVTEPSPYIEGYTHLITYFESSAWEIDIYYKQTQG